MIDDRFSPRAFQECLSDPERGRRLCQLLDEEVTKEMHAAVLDRFLTIIQRLNELGHELREYECVPGDISFRDGLGEGVHYEYKLRLAIDTTVSSGYAHLSDVEYDGSQDSLDTPTPP